MNNNSTQQAEPLTKISEHDFSQKVLQRLDKHFFIREQVWGVDSFGKNRRIDAVIRPRDNDLWKRKDIAFGIEFKTPTSCDGPSYVTSLIRQSYDYLHTKWEGAGSIPILICPLMLNDRIGTQETMDFTRKILGQLGIGEIKNTREHRGLAIVFSKDCFVWCEKYGVCYGKSWGFNYSK